MKGEKWFKKSLVVLVSIFTFGMVSPSDIPWLSEAEAHKNPKKDTFEETKKDRYSLIKSDQEQTSQNEFNRDIFIDSVMLKAEENAYTKFGEKIGPKIEDDFNSIVLPKMEEAIAEMVAQYPEEKLIQLAVTDTPAPGRAEKIFHIYNEDSGKDVIRFHVRQENPPQEGYWFNFHYHTYHDQFATHYEIGKIYWDKNTPPKWSERTYIS